MRPVNVKAMLALIKDEPEDQYIPIIKAELVNLLNENRQLRRKNSQLGGKLARLRREKDGPKSTEIERLILKSEPILKAGS